MPDNLPKLQQHLTGLDVQAVLVTDLTNVRWLTGFSGTFGMAVVQPLGGTFLTDSRYRIQAAEEVTACECRAFSRPTNANQFLAENLQRLEISRIGVDENQVTLGQLKQWQAVMPQIEFVAIQDACAQLRMIKSPDEVAIMQRACNLADECMKQTLAQVREGISERELHLKILQFLLEHDSAPSFEPIVVSGPRSARPHGTASDRKLTRGDFVTFDLGAVVDGYCSDITRTIVVGQATDRHREVYGLVLEAEEECIKACVAGTNGKDLDQLAREILNRADLAQYFTHGLGHGLGTVVHDSGRLSSTDDQPIENGQVWTIEPGVYIEGFGGVRIEDDIVVTSAGPKILTHSPKKLLEL